MSRLPIVDYSSYDRSPAILHVVTDGKTWHVRLGRIAHEDSRPRWPCHNGRLAGRQPAKRYEVIHQHGRDRVLAWHFLYFLS